MQLMDPVADPVARFGKKISMDEVACSLNELINRVISTCSGCFHDVC
jgi:hypothetical protein